MAYNVGRRTREIGIRMALGAQGTSVMWLVMREVLVLLGAGVAIAIPAAWGLSRLVASQLYGITPNDPEHLRGHRNHRPRGGICHMSRLPRDPDRSHPRLAV